MLRLRTLVVLITLAVSIAACGSDDEVGDASTPESPSATAEFDRDATLAVGVLSAAAQGWDPHLVTSANANVASMFPVFDRFFQLNADFEPQPMLATEYEFSDDLLTLTLNLRDDVVFWNGTPFDAEVAKANLERAQRLLVPGSLSNLPNLDSVSVVDPYTIELHLTEPDPTLLIKLSSYAGMMVEPSQLDQEQILEPIASGPYVPDLAATSQTNIVMTRNEDYWDPEAARVSRLELVLLPDEQTRLNALIRGEVQAAFFTPGSYPDVEAAAGDGMQLYTAPGMSTIMVAMNLDSEPALRNPEVRRALSLAIDRQAISDALLNGQCAASAQVFMPGGFGYDSALDEQLVFDPAQARAILEAEGASDLRLQAVAPVGTPMERVLPALQSQWEDIGVTVSIQNLPAGEFATAFGEGRGDLGVHQYSGSQTQALLDYQAKTIGTEPTWFTDLAEQIFATNQDSAEAEELYDTMAQRLFDEPINLPICRPSSIVLAQDNVTGADELPYIRITQTLDPTVLGVLRP